MALRKCKRRKRISSWNRKLDVFINQFMLKGISLINELFDLWDNLT